MGFAIPPLKSGAILNVKKEYLLSFYSLYLVSQRKLLEPQVDLLKSLFKAKTRFLKGIEVPPKIFPRGVSLSKIPH